MIRLISHVALLCAVAISVGVYAASLTGRLWEEGTFHISTGDLTTTSVGPDDWEAAFNTAAGRWNADVPFTVTTDALTQNESCGANEPNTTFFSDTRCGNAWSGNVVGVSATWAAAHNGYAIQTSIVFNNTVTWDVFDGAGGGPDVEFTRVAVHEIGHSIGLDHTTVADAIMFPSAGDTFSPEPDDRAAVQLIYGTADLVELPDINQNGMPEFAALRARQSDGRGRVQIKESDGTPVRTTLYFQGYDAVGLLQLADLNGSGDPELGVMERRQSDGRTLVEIRDSQTGASVNNVWFSPAFTGLSAAVMDDLNGSGFEEIVVMQIRTSDERVVAQVRDASTKQLIRNVYYSLNTWPIDFTIVPDMNGNGADEIAALLVRRSDQLLLIQIRDALTGSLLNTIFHPAGFTGQGIAVVGDINANGEPELATLVRRNSDGDIGVRLSDSSTGASLKRIWYRNASTVVSSKALVVVPDTSGNGFDEVGVLLQRDSDSRPMVQLRDASTGALTQTVWLAPGFVAESVSAVPSINGGSAEELGVLGFSGNYASQARVHDSSTAVRLSFITFPLP